MAQDKETPLQAALQKMKRSLVYASIFSLASNVMMLALPMYSMLVMDKVFSSHSLETLIMLTVIVVVFFAFYSFFSAVRGMILSSIAEWMDRSLAPELLSYAITRSSAGGGMTSAASMQRDLAVVRGFVGGQGAAALLDIPWSLIFLFVIYAINPILGLVTVVGILIMLVFGVVNELATKKIVERAAKHSTKAQIMADTAGRNSEAVESMGMMHAVIANWEATHKSACAEQDIASGRATLIQSISRFLRMIIQVAMTGVGAYLVIRNELTMGGMIASSTLAGRALAPFEAAINLWKSWISTRDSWHRLNKHFEVKQALHRGSVALPAPKGLLTVESLVYTPSQSAPIIKGINFSLAPGEGLGIIGPSAAGKSTLAKLIIGLLPPTHGTVRLDGVETFKWNRKDFGQYVGYLPQQVDLFSGTIKDNIARLDVNAPMEKVLEAAMAAGVHDMVLRLPKGYETECGDGNLGLSPGQRQRIGMARALYGNPRFVVLDEPNLNLDGDGERMLVEALARLRAHKISHVVVAHRPTIVSTVDKILVMRAGTIENFGARDDVLRHYANQSAQNQSAQSQSAQNQPDNNTAVKAVGGE